MMSGQPRICPVVVWESTEFPSDETWWKDMWLLFAAAADKTSQIRMGPNVTHVILRDPAHVAQMAATLDQLTNGRAEIVVSFGNISMLPQHGVDTTGMKPLSRVMEAREVMRKLLDDGAVSYDGEFFKHTGLWTLARPIQEKLPIKLGAMGGPRSFAVGGELFDGVHQAIGTSKETCEYMVEHARKGAEKAGCNLDDLDLGAWLVMSVMEDSHAAKETARIMAAFYLSAMPEQQLNRHGNGHEAAARRPECVRFRSRRREAAGPAPELVRFRPRPHVTVTLPLQLAETSTPPATGVGGWHLTRNRGSEAAGPASLTVRGARRNEFRRGYR